VPEVEIEEDDDEDDVDEMATGEVTPVELVLELALEDCAFPLVDDPASLETPLYRKSVCCSKNGSPHVITSAIVHPREKMSILSLRAGSHGCTAPVPPPSNPSAIAEALARFALAFIGACV
jgi:hypothetical protein